MRRRRRGYLLKKLLRTDADGFKLTERCTGCPVTAQQWSSIKRARWYLIVLKYLSIEDAMGVVWIKCEGVNDAIGKSTPNAR